MLAGQDPLPLVSVYGDGDREKAIVALLHAHNADINAQDGEVSLCTCAPLQGK